MNAPNRFAEVDAVVRPTTPFPGGDAHDPYRLNVLQSFIIPTLNLLDNGKWGCLTKTDQGNKVPCDVLVWKDTNEAFDVMNGQGATWGAIGIIDNPNWKWTPVDSPAPAPVPTPTPEPTPTPVGPSNAELMTKLLQVEAKVQEIEDLIDRLNQALIKQLGPVVLKIMGMP